MGVACVTFWGGIWGPSHRAWGEDMGTTCILLWVGTWDPRRVLRGGMRRPSHRGWGQPGGTLVLELGCGDPGMGAGTRGPWHDACGWGPLLWVWDAGTLAQGLGSGLGGPSIGVGVEGPCVRASTWGHPHGDRDLGTTVRGPQHLPGAQRAGTGGRWGQVASVLSPLAGTVTGGQIQVPTPPPWVAPDNSDAAPEPLHPILIQPSPRNPAAMKKKPANGRGPDPVPPQQRARGIAKPAEVIYPRAGGGTTPRDEVWVRVHPCDPPPNSTSGCSACPGGGGGGQL